MRLDKFLSIIKIFKSRSLGAEAISASMVMINNQPAKASKEIQAGSIIEIETPRFYKKLKVLSLPPHNISRAQTASLFQLLDERIKD